MKLFVVSQKNKPLSIAEVKALYPKTIAGVTEHFVFVKSKKNYYEKLAYTKGVYDILFCSNKKKLFSFIKKQNWNKIIKNPYCVRSSWEERRIAALIWDTLKNPKVSLGHPQTEIHLFFIGKKVFVTKLIWKNELKFLQRKAQYRPGFYPASLDPQLALAMVNLSGVIGSNGKGGGTIIDPFCGTGGILIEAAFSGRKAIGFDISNWMLEKCKTNLAHYGLEKKVTVTQGDATTFRKKCDAIITELPFGKNTKSQDLELLYSQFLENAARNTNKIVVSFPDFVDYKKLIQKSKWKIKEQFLWYLHHSMSKWIVVVERK